MYVTGTVFVVQRISIAKHLQIPTTRSFGHLLAFVKQQLLFVTCVDIYLDFHSFPPKLLDLAYKS